MPPRPSGATAFAGLVSTARAIAADGASELAEWGRRPAQFLLLAAVARHPDWSQQRLADEIGVTKGNVSQLVTRLTEEGLVERADGRLRVAAAGIALLDDLLPAHDAFLERAFSVLDDAELHALLACLERLRTHAGRIGSATEAGR